MKLLEENKKLYHLIAERMGEAENVEESWQGSGQSILRLVGPARLAKEPKRELTGWGRYHFQPGRRRDLLELIEQDVVTAGRGAGFRVAGVGDSRGIVVGAELPGVTITARRTTKEEAVDRARARDHEALVGEAGRVTKHNLEAGVDELQLRAVDLELVVISSGEARALQDNAQSAVAVEPHGGAAVQFQHTGRVVARRDDTVVGRGVVPNRAPAGERALRSDRERAGAESVDCGRVAQ